MSATVAALLTCAYYRCLPDPLFNEPRASIMLDRDGEFLGARIAADGQWRFPAQPQVPQKFATALIAYEDKRFQTHHGVDVIALARALYLDAKHWRIVSGGSTLTMQLARVIRAEEERGIDDKLMEIVLATRLELKYSKSQILALYAANAPFGGNVVGLEAAAWRYFGRSPERLSWAEAAALAVLPNSPARVHLGRNRRALEAKRNALLARLHARGELNDLDMKLALSEPLPARPAMLPDLAPHLLDTLRAASPQRYRFVTTLDGQLQADVASIVRQRAAELETQDIHNAAAIVIDNRNFEVLAYVGNAEWAVANDRSFAVDIVRRPRSTGSAFKPLLYAYMLESGEILPHTLIADVPTQYAGYVPENFDRTYRGAVAADVVLAQSLNVPAVRMLKQFGVQRFYDSLRRAGLTTLTRAPDEYGLTLILGGAESTLWELANQYANLAFIARQNEISQQPIRYRRTRLLRDDVPELGNVADYGPASAWFTLSALQEVTRPGEESQWKQFANAQKIAWKTGTSWGFRDAWAIGDTSRYTVAVWVGNATGEGRAGLTGSAAAAPIMFDIFKHLEPSPWFVRPTRYMKEVLVCKNDGYLANGACEAESQYVPRSSNFDRLSPNNLLVHLDAAGRRVASDCEGFGQMRHIQWFTLPPAEEFYYRRLHADYQALPAPRNDCVQDNRSKKAPMDFLYPSASARIYIPVDLASEKSRTVFEAVHRNPQATLYWHLDDEYLATTRTFHQQALDVKPGVHVITIVDEAGNRLSRRFEVVGNEE